MTVQRRIRHLEAARHVLGEPDLRRLLTAHAMFTITEWATWIALLVYAHGVGGAELAGTAAVAMMIPTALLAPPLASLIDRLPRRTGLLAGYGGLVMTALATGISIMSGAGSAVVIGVGTALSVLVSATRVAHGSAIPALSPDPRSALAATAVGGSIDGAGGLVGPLVAAGLLLADPGLLFIVMGALLIPTTAGIARIEGGRGKPAAVQTEGAGSAVYTALLKRPDIMSVIAIGGLSQVVIGAMDILLVVLAIEVLELGDAGAGLLNSLFGLGSIAAGLVAIRLVGKPRLGRAIGRGTAAVAAPLMLAAPFPMASLAFPIAGLGRTYADVAGRTLLHRLVPPEAMGRAFGVLESLSMGGLALGAGLAPWLVGSTGVSVTLVTVGLITPVGFIVLWRLIRLADRQARVPAEAIGVLQMVPEFALLDPIRLERLALDSALQTTVAGEHVTREGDEGSVAWVVVDGRFRVSTRGRVVAELVPGQIVGEIALLHATPRTADVISVEDGRLLRLDRAAFLEVVSTGGSDAHHINQLASRRLEQLDQLSD